MALSNAERQARHRAMRPLGFWGAMWEVAGHVPGPITDQTVAALALVYNRPVDVVRAELESRMWSAKGWDARTRARESGQ